MTLDDGVCFCLIGWLGGLLARAKAYLDVCTGSQRPEQTYPGVKVGDDS